MSRTRIPARLFLSLLAGMALCRPAAAIQGGSPGRMGDRLARATVAVGTLVRNGDSVGFSYCSGVLIRPDVVLTAAHCVSQDPLASVVLSYDGSRMGNEPHAVATVARYTVPADIPGEFAGMMTTLSLDTALLRLATPVRNRAPIPVAAPGIARVSQLRLAGGGLSGRRAGQLRTTALIPIIATGSGLVIARAENALVCSGDSGGPVVVEGRGGPVVVGVASAVLTRNPPCGALVVVAPARPQF